MRKRDLRRENDRLLFESLRGLRRKVRSEGVNAEKVALVRDLDWFVNGRSNCCQRMLGRAINVVVNLLAAVLRLSV